MSDLVATLTLTFSDKGGSNGGSGISISLDDESHDDDRPIVLGLTFTSPVQYERQILSTGIANIAVQAGNSAIALQLHGAYGGRVEPTGIRTRWVRKPVSGGSQYVTNSPTTPTDFSVVGKTGNINVKQVGNNFIAGGIGAAVIEYKETFYLYKIHYSIPQNTVDAIMNDGTKSVARHVLEPLEVYAFGDNDQVAVLEIPRQVGGVEFSWPDGKCSPDDPFVEAERLAKIKRIYSDSDPDTWVDVEEITSISLNRAECLIAGAKGKFAKKEAGVPLGKKHGGSAVGLPPGTTVKDGKVQVRDLLSKIKIKMSTNK